MNIFSATLGQIAVLFITLFLGWILGRCRALPDQAATVLAKLESTVFIPALVLGTFLKSFTPDKLAAEGRLFLISCGIQMVMIALALVFSRVCARGDDYVRRLYLYGLSYANFAYVGNALISAIFPELFLDYLVFTLPLWIGIFVWGIPALLIPKEKGDTAQTPQENNRNRPESDPAKARATALKARLKPLLNPMLLSMLAGIVIGLVQLPVPAFLSQSLDALAACMSPAAMLLTGLVLAGMPLKKVLSRPGIYAVSAVRLLLFPLLAVGFFKLFPMDRSLMVCTVCSLAMPLGLNTTIIPAAYGQDTQIGAGMTVVSHVCAVATIPLVFWLLLGA